LDCILGILFYFPSSFYIVTLCIAPVHLFLNELILISIRTCGSTLMPLAINLFLLPIRFPSLLSVIQNIFCDWIIVWPHDLLKVCRLR
jgi:hypothetical protein